MTIFDAFMFFNELDMIEARFNILQGVVDYHVIVESDMTHSGQRKPRYFQDAWDAGRFDAFKDRIIFQSISELHGANSWERERYNRWMLSMPLDYCAKADDLVIVGDADEIPNPDAVRQITGNGARLELDFYYYTVNRRVKQGWSIGARRWGKGIDPNDIRTLAGADVPTILSGGWHFSYFASPEGVAQKLDAFMHHGDIAKDVPRDPTWLGAKMRAGEDIIGRGLPIEHVELENTLPHHILDNQDRYRALGWIE